MTEENDSCKEEMFLLAPSGEKRHFSAAELAKQLDLCFADAGMREAGYLSEDIALALQYRLYHSPASGNGETEDGETVFRADEVDGMLCSLLNDLDLPEVSEAFRKRNGIMSYRILPDLDAVRRVTSRTLAEAGEKRREHVAVKVFEALRALRLSMATERLMAELAKNFDGELPPGLPDAPSSPASRADGEYLAEATDILSAGAGGLLYDYYENEIISFSGISRYLPALRVRIRLLNFAAAENLSSPALELELFGKLDRLSDALTELHKAAKELCPEREFPVFLHFVDLKRFVEAYFGGDVSRRRGGRGDEICGEIANALPFSSEIVIP